MIETIIETARAKAGVASQLDFDQFPNIIAMFDAAVSNYADKPAFSSLGKTITLRELDQLSRQFAAFLQQQPQLQRGDRIAIQMPNLIQYPVALFGAMRAGFVVVNTNPLYSAPEVEHQLNDSGAKALVVLANFAHNVSTILSKTSVQLVIVTELADLHAPLKRTVINFGARYIKHLVPAFSIPGAISFRAALRGDASKLKGINAQPDDLAVLQYTGGTTGVAKGAMLSHRNLIANALQGAAMFATYGLRPASETFIAPLPLCHIYSFTVGMILLSSGNHSVLIPNPRDLKHLISEMRRYPFTGFTGLNTLFVALSQNPDFATLDFSRMKTTVSGGMALTGGAAQRWRQITGCDVYEGYGLTEASPVVSVNPGTNNQIGTIGVAVPGTHIKVVDEENRELDLNQPGELCVKGPQVMLGYWQRADETRKVLDDDGWLRTGDIAIVREDGYIKIVDRKKDVIVVSGFKVFPGEVEDVLSRHPDILECAVIGVPDEHSGEVVKAFVVRRSDSLTEQQVRDFCHENLTGYKVPKQVEFRDDLPKSNVGKVLRRELRDEETKKLTQTAK
ncbi:MAG: long-chain-fatty-acid--CoA ligase [Verrucomicrobiaceae bacterium]|nr:long-chain-fatty-acid--CoA ligase [Verrucomicrobiaceae bacterium]